MRNLDLADSTAFVKEPAMLARVDGGGTALAALFEGDARLVAQAWRVAGDRADEGISTQSLELASDRAQREALSLDDTRPLTQLQASAAQRHHSPRSTAGPGSGESQPSSVAEGEDVRQGTSPENVRRRLVDPESLMIAEPMGAVEYAPLGRRRVIPAGTHRPRAELNEPRVESRQPQNRIRPPGYSDLDKENVGFELFLRALGASRDDNSDWLAPSNKLDAAVRSA